MHESVTLFDYWRRSDEQGFFAMGVSLFWAEADRVKVLSKLPVDFRKQVQLGDGLIRRHGLLRSADVALVTMVPGSETVAMPSRSAMMAGQAIVAIAPEDSDLSIWSKSRTAAGSLTRATSMG